MKRKVSLILAIIMVTTLCISSFVHAEQGMSLEDAIKFAKGILEISEDYTEFNYGVNNYGEEKTWNLRWSKDDMYGSSIEVMMDDSGDILRYYNYNYKGTESGKKLPNLSRSEAQKIAEDFIKKLNPQDVFDSLKLVQSDQRSFRETSHFFYYIATYDGVPVPFNNIRVTVNYDTGEIQDYNKAWTDDIEFPKADDALSMEDAEKTYKEKLGLQLTYNLAGDKVYLAYTPVYSSQYVIDAITGEVVDPSQSMRGVYYDEMLFGGMGERAGSAKEQAVPVLTPEEIKSIEESGELISQEEAEKIAREFKIFEIDDSFILDGASLRRGWDFERNYIWDLYLLKEDREAKDYKYINVLLNAKTGEMLSFDISYPMAEGENKYTEEEAKKAVEEFLEKIQPEKFKNTKYEKSDNDVIIPIMERETGIYNFRYVRMVKGIPFVDNYLNVRFDGRNGKIYGFYMNWQEVDFPSAEGVLKLEEIYDFFFENVGLNLEYRKMNLPYFIPEMARAVAEAAGVAVDAAASVAVDSAADVAVTSGMPVAEATKKSVSLVYTVNTGKPSILDAFTGELLNADGQPYVEEAPIEYTDISDHYAKEQIEALVEIGIGLEGPTFRPNEKIKQKDFLLLISQIIDRGYEFYNKTALENDSETENLYNLLIREGIVKEGEKDPEAALTREESVKFVIRALKYDKIADLKDIFKCEFLDKDEIDADLIGHVVLAKGFNIVNGYGNYFRPKEELKRGDAIIIIYNSLKI
jgi:hypothetical protein